MDFKKYFALITTVTILGTASYLGKIETEITERPATNQSKLEVMIEQNNWTGKGIGALLRFSGESNSESKREENKNREYPPKIMYNDHVEENGEGKESEKITYC